MPILQSGIVKPSSGYTIDQSLRFNDDDSAYLNRTAGTATSNDIGTFSFWTKRGNLGGGNSFFSNHSDANNRTYIGFDADTITMFGKISGSANVELLTTPVFRDPGAWYHIVIAVDVTQASASNRVKIYVNGNQITSFSTSDYPAQNTDLPLFSKTNHQVGAFFSSSIGDYYDGLLSEYHYIDGQQLAPSSFAETNSTTNQWQAVEYAGSYGNNGFYLKFQDASALGDDSSGNTNDFTVNNLVATDQVLDSPSNSFATLNPLVPAAVSGSIFSEGNLKYRTYKTGGDNVQGEGTIGFTSGKWYWEIYLVGFEGSTARRGGIGVGDAISNETWTTACTEAAILSVGNLNPQAHNVVNASIGSSWSTGAAGDIWCCAFDADAGTFIITKNTAITGSESDGKWTGFATSAVGYRPITVEQSASDYTEFVYNFGQDSSFANNKTSGAAGSDFYFTPPTGYRALTSKNIPTVSANTFTYKGNANADGPFVYMGYTPSAITISSTTYSLSSTNPSDSIDWLSNGIKVRSSSVRNSNGTSYSITSAPISRDFKYSNAR